MASHTKRSHKRHPASQWEFDVRESECSGSARFPPSLTERGTADTSPISTGSHGRPDESDDMHQSLQRTRQRYAAGELTDKQFVDQYLRDLDMLAPMGITLANPAEQRWIALMGTYGWRLKGSADVDGKTRGSFRRGFTSRTQKIAMLPDETYENLSRLSGSDKKKTDAMMNMSRWNFLDGRDGERDKIKEAVLGAAGQLREYIKEHNWHTNSAASDNPSAASDPSRVTAPSFHAGELMPQQPTSYGSPWSTVQPSHNQPGYSQGYVPYGAATAASSSFGTVYTQPSSSQRSDSDFGSQGHRYPPPVGPYASQAASFGGTSRHAATRAKEHDIAFMLNPSEEEDDA
ncbi:hypothetical protein IAR55_003166 [Kwoniella newhampshirensis]|uniref:Uncharacterized protein n=1 Tax=Kwoniella newhampshirensis TaxID=1651941 RepID=A0AAW0YYC7_9TREE